MPRIGSVVARAGAAAPTRLSRNRVARTAATVRAARTFQFGQPIQPRPRRPREPLLHLQGAAPWAAPHSLASVRARLTCKRRHCTLLPAADVE